MFFVFNLWTAFVIFFLLLIPSDSPGNGFDCECRQRMQWGLGGISMHDKQVKVDLTFFYGGKYIGLTGKKMCPKLNRKTTNFWQKSKDERIETYPVTCTQACITPGSIDRIVTILANNIFATLHTPQRDILGILRD